MTFTHLLPLTHKGRVPARSAEFTALDTTTTGLRPGHVLEIGAVRVRADGTVLDEFTSLTNPGWNIETGSSHVHGVTRRDLDDAPGFGEILGRLFDLCRGSVLVAHNLPFVDAFLAAELTRLRIALPPLPAVSTLDAARQALRLPNYQLATVAGALGIDDFPAHLALARARTCGYVVAALVTTHGFAFADQPALPDLPQYPTVLPLPRRETSPGRGWLSDLLVRVPLAAGTDPSRDAHRELLTIAVADQSVSADEGRKLGALAVDAGIPWPEVRQTHQHYVSAMRGIAEDDGLITEAEVRDLRRVAHALDVPEVVADLRPNERGARPTRVLVLGETPEADALRAAVLRAGIRLAPRLTEAVTHLLAGDDVSPRDPRLVRAADLGIMRLDLRSGWTALGLIAPGEPRPPQQAHPWQVWAARALMGAGLVVMLLTLVALFAGAAVVGGLFLGVFGVAALVGGWYLSEPATG
ncbi:MAG TPA: 3'-5' exonuclease [Amycolatopsis sp.]|nr:3'-5' exonuclease [Amycolatopsis sp.]